MVRLLEIGYYHIMQPNDTPWDIAAAHGISFEALIAADDGLSRGCCSLDKPSSSWQPPIVHNSGASSR